MNGSTGRIVEAHRDHAKAVIDGHEHRLSAVDANHIELAYAISVHKAQGSQWPLVIVPVYRSRILDRTLIYTAATRASEQVVLVGDRDVFKSAVEMAQMNLTRDVTLASRLRSITGMTVHHTVSLIPSVLASNTPAGRYQHSSGSVNDTHHAVNELNEHRDVAQVVTGTSLIDELPRVTLQPQHDVLIHVLEEPFEGRYVSVRRLKLRRRRRRRRVDPRNQRVAVREHASARLIRRLKLRLVLRRNNAV